MARHFKDKIIEGDCIEELKKLADGSVDLVFADPPYDVSTAEVQRILELLGENGWATTGTIAVLERPVAAAEIDPPRGWEALEPRRYGDTRLEWAEFG